ncbi:IS1634 family transposase [Kitasatospora sp. NBC_01300]|uniref:IS1634 family transposase n=1 Tax=Kitasatospora sp. NBC_01300 TaxID=2903574 RepID=UPI002F90F59C|nr:IS1634 family transposase [Kitasatospora sp. NBC_01300]WSK07775.1 IS1634 family transposase [Kitasatospora sp. NBC_01300]WSK08867.1 IS1634 family transposase [Kitasatospora sp. NBC_01300]WSK09955.1 IS1634 family transposase [Kitasatospora sp. NBC_01300]
MVEKRLGALPVAAEFLRRLDVAGIVDGLCPSAPSAHLTHGQVIEALVANRLTSPIPLFRVGDWARTWAVEEVLGIEAGLLNDDRLARALDAIAPKLEQLAGTVGARAITEFGIDVSRLHWDMTSMSVHGAYPLEDQDDAFPVIKHGHPKDRRVDLKQVQAGLAVTGDGGIPVHARVFGGGAAEVSQVVGAMKDLRKLAGEQDFLLVADSKLVSYPNVAALLAAGTAFIAPVPAAQVKDGFYAALDLEAATVVDWVPDRDAGKDPARREVYRVLEDVHTLNGPRKRDPVLSVRRILVHSTGNAAGQQAARNKRLTRAAEDLDKVQRGAGGKYYNTVEKIAARIGVIAKTRRVASCLRTEIGEDDNGRPTLAWHFDQQVLDDEAAADGWYALLTALAPEQADPGQVLIQYKGQGSVERRYADFKGPLAVTPLFVQHNHRVAALIQVICLALLVFSLIERQVRQALGPEQTMVGLYPDNRRVRPTGRMILYHLSELTLRIGNVTDPPTVQISRGVQLHLLDLLGIEVTQTRWPMT